MRKGAHHRQAFRAQCASCAGAEARLHTTNLSKDGCMNKRLWLSWVVLLVVSAAFAGCGGDDDAEPEAGAGGASGSTAGAGAGGTSGAGGASGAGGMAATSVPCGTATCTSLMVPGLPRSEERRVG